MRQVAVILLLAIAASAATISIKGPTGNFTAAVTQSSVYIDNKNYTIQNAQLQWYFNGTYASYGVYYSNQNCEIGTWPNRPELFIRCTTGSDFVIVAVKDPKAVVTCTSTNSRAPLVPETALDKLLVFRYRGLDIDCKASFAPAVEAPRMLISALAGLTTASATALAILAVLLVRKIRQQ